MGNELKAVVRCEVCQLDSVGSTLGEALKGLCCKTEESGVTHFHKPFITVDGKSVYEMKRVIEDDYKGETNLSGIPAGQPPAKEEEPPKEPEKEPEKTEDSNPEPTDVPIAEQDPKAPERKPGE